MFSINYVLIIGFNVGLADQGDEDILRLHLQTIHQLVPKMVRYIFHS